jgi:hypothetical protein
VGYLLLNDRKQRIADVEQFWNADLLALSARRAQTQLPLFDKADAASGYAQQFLRPFDCKVADRLRIKTSTLSQK